MAFSLLPREDSYFALFTKAADTANRGAIRLNELMANYVQVSVAMNEIKDIEHQGDKITHEIIDRLNRSFITPLEREDIHALVHSIDDIIDWIDAATVRLHVYEIDQPTEELRSLVAVLARSAAEVKETVAALANLKQADAIFAKCKHIKQLEHQSDEIFRLALQRLFREEKDALQVIKWKEIYEKIEQATDMCERVAKIIEAIVLKHA